MNDEASTTEDDATPADEADDAVADAPARSARELEKRWGSARDPGFVYLPSVLLRAQPRLKINAIELAVLVHLIDHWWSSTEMPFPSKRRLAERLSVSEKTVQRAIAKLEALGLVRRVARHLSAGGQTSNAYDLSSLVERLKEIAADVMKAREEARGIVRKAERPGLRKRRAKTAEADA